MNTVKLQQMLQQFFLEDIGERDVTSEMIFPSKQQATGVFLAKEDGVLAGIDVITTGYHLLDRTIEITLYKRDGESIKRGTLSLQLLVPSPHY